ncbi:SDR family NAD(P)-dependent oxidoreductase [Neorhizobium galegae]|uniref:SDR family NAD(P)-dependent oxidoreductase n=1 Tax=Neorhizobium galegae TaxID=399 RepID=UPI00062136CE|nr:SDR family NAD(P)-dependent oxidoreductase [Neorhizobium galegae]CDZ45438.1 Short-chain dehydrogenase/reductase SDR [Neorhizobium galegae bv. orientalis]
MATLMGKRILVIGGSSGIGLGVATAVLDKGAEVVIVGRSQEKLQAAERALAAVGKVSTFVADMTQEAEIARLFAGIGGLDHLVSTAGTPPPDYPIGDTDLNVVRGFIDNKLVGAVLVAKHAIRTLKKGGSMTFTSGINKDKPPVPGGSVVAAHRRVVRLFRACAVAGTGADKGQRGVAGLGRYTHVHRTGRRE